MAQIRSIPEIPAAIQDVIDQATEKGQEYVNDYGVLRIPAIVSNERYLSAGDTKGIISLWVNFQAVEWSMPIRSAIQKTAAGAVRYVWRRSRDTYYDVFPVRLTFHSGNIHPDMYAANSAVPPGLSDFHRFLELVDDRQLLDDGRENYVVIVHTSNIFPSIILKGWMAPEGPAWTENIDNVMMLSWTASMEVMVSIPKLSNADELTRLFTIYGAQLVPTRRRS